MEHDNLESIIEDSLTDSITEPISDDQVVDNTPAPDTTEVAPEGQPEAPEAPVETDESDSTLEVASPTLKAAESVQDEFAKKHGLPAQVPGARENRIPYTRVKSIVAKAEKEAKELAIKEYAPKLQEYETKVADYEGRLGQVAQFEHIMANDGEKFLGMLSTLPAYQPFFEQYRQLVTFYEQHQGGAQAQPQTGPEGTDNEKPQPDEQQPDGTWLYSDEQLDKLMAWRERQVEARITKQIQDRYAPIESEWQRKQQELAQQKYLTETVIPQIQQQIAEAKTWPMFNENEAEITKVLNENPNLNLEGAYRQVVFPKIMTNRDKMRQELLAELQKAPVAPTSAPASRTKPVAQQHTGPRSLEDIIAEAAQTLK